METLQTVVNKLKVDFAKKAETNLIVNNYGIKFCVDSPFVSFNSKKLELIFLSNLCYLSLKENQLNRILVQNYKDLFKKKAYCLNVDDIELEDPVIVNNYITNNYQVDDYWDQTDF